jgi:hypothetical protein
MSGPDREQLAAELSRLYPANGRGRPKGRPNTSSIIAAIWARQFRAIGLVGKRLGEAVAEAMRREASYDSEDLSAFDRALVKAEERGLQVDAPRVASLGAERAREAQAALDAWLKLAAGGSVKLPATPTEPADIRCRGCCGAEPGEPCRAYFRGQDGKVGHRARDEHHHERVAMAAAMSARRRVVCGETHQGMVEAIRQKARFERVIGRSDWKLTAEEADQLEERLADERFEARRDQRVNAIRRLTRMFHGDFIPKSTIEPSFEHRSNAKTLWWEWLNRLNCWELAEVGELLGRDAHDEYRRLLLSERRSTDAMNRRGLWSLDYEYDTTGGAPKTLYDYIPAVASGVFEFFGGSESEWDTGGERNSLLARQPTLTAPADHQFQEWINRHESSTPDSSEDQLGRRRGAVGSRVCPGRERDHEGISSVRGGRTAADIRRAA